MLKRLKLGLVGAGPAAERLHVPAIRGVPEVQAWMVADVDMLRARRVQDLCPFEHATNNYEDFCGEVDLAIVGLPNALHEPVACRLLKAGVHVLCEKPQARTVAECRRMIAAAKPAGALLAAGHNRRLKKNVLEARLLLSRGCIGRVTRLHTEEGSRADWPRSKAYFDPALAGGGAMLDVGIHAIDLIRFLVGEFVSVEYSGNGTSAQVESEGHLRFKLAGGAEGEVLASRDRDLRQELVLVGADGELRVGLWEQSLVLQRPRGKAFRHFDSLQLNPVARANDASFVDQLYRFAAAIRGLGKPSTTAEDGLEAVRIVEWGYTGARPA